MINRRARRTLTVLGLAGPLASARAALDPGRCRDRRDQRHMHVLLAASLSPGSSCIDVGANVGDVLAQIRRLAPQGRHVAFEPLPDLAAALRAQFPEVDVREAALAEEAGEAEFVHVVDRPGYSGLRERDYPGRLKTERIRVRIARLDDELGPAYVPDLIKIDVEGAERAVIAGGLETIARHRPLVVFEHGLGAAERYGTRPEQIHDLLVGQAGLQLFDIDGRGPLSRDELVETFEARTLWTFFARE